MKTRHSFSSILLVMALNALMLVALAGGYLVGQFCCEITMDTKDELAWLRRQFHLPDAIVKQVRESHEKQRMERESIASELLRHRSELEALLVKAEEVTPELQRKIYEFDQAAARSQLLTLRHAYEISRLLPPAEGRCYLSEVYRAALRVELTPNHLLLAHANKLPAGR